MAAYKAALGSGPPAAAHFNATGAGFPDISAQGVEYSVVAGGLDMARLPARPVPVLAALFTLEGRETQ